MRSTKITIGVASAVTVVLALMLAGWAAGAGTSSAATPVGSGKASATKSVCGLGTGKKATGAPIKLGGIDMLIPGVDFTTIGKVARRTSTASTTTAASTAGRSATPSTTSSSTRRSRPRSRGSSSRATRSSASSATRASPSAARTGSTTSRKGFTVIGAGVQAECFGTPVLRRDEHGPALLATSAPRRRSSAPGAKSLVVASPARSRRTPTAARSWSPRQAGIPGKSFPTSRCP